MHADLPFVVGSISSARVSMKRLDKFFNREEVLAAAIADGAAAAAVRDGGGDGGDAHEGEHETVGLLGAAGPMSTAPLHRALAPPAPPALDFHIVITGGCYSWMAAPRVDERGGTCDGAAAASDTRALTNVNLAVRRGELLGVVGAVGAGKSSLLAAVLGELRRDGGEAHVSGTIAYVPQHAWILNATVRDNILCGRPLDMPRYARARMGVARSWLSVVVGSLRRDTTACIVWLL